MKGRASGNSTYDLAACCPAEEEGCLGVLDGLGSPLVERPLGARRLGFAANTEDEKPTCDGKREKGDSHSHLAQHGREMSFADKDGGVWQLEMGWMVGGRKAKRKSLGISLSLS